MVAVWLVECHLMRLVLVDVHLAGGRERLPDDVDPPTHKRRTSQEVQKPTRPQVGGILADTIGMRRRWQRKEFGRPIREG